MTNLNENDYSILSCIAENPEYDSTDISDELSLSRGKVDNTIHRFRKKNLLVSADSLPNSASTVEGIRNVDIDEEQQEEHNWILLEDGRAHILDHLVSLQQRVNRVSKSLSKSKVYRNEAWSEVSQGD